jgi:cytochrome bd-type quinol oxidase subunit 2
MQYARLMTDRTARRWIWVAVAAQAIGYIVDAFWHARLEPGNEPATVAEMARHLATVHMPLYVGAACVLVATSVALEQRTRYAPAGIARPVALAGAALSAFAECWHAIAHLSLDTRHAPLFGILSVAGFLIVIGATAVSRGTRRRRPADARGSRRAAA